MAWRVEFIIDSSGMWRNSVYRFSDPVDASNYAEGITPIRKYRLVESTDALSEPPSPQSPPWTSPPIP